MHVFYRLVDRDFPPAPGSESLKTRSDCFAGFLLSRERRSRFSHFQRSRLPVYSVCHRLNVRRRRAAGDQ